jgi:hypothetical protein
VAQTVSIAQDSVGIVAALAAPTVDTAPLLWAEHADRWDHTVYYDNS